MLTKEGVLAQVNEIFRDVLENDNLVIKNETTADDVEEWDSLTHLQLVVAIEKHFNIRFTSSEIINFSNVGEMCEGILEKIAV